MIGTSGGLFHFDCDRCGAVASADGRPIQFGTLQELAVVAIRDGWLDDGRAPDSLNAVVCPPCREQVMR